MQSSAPVIEWFNGLIRRMAIFGVTKVDDVISTARPTRMSGTRPPLPLVVASVLSAAAIWVPIYNLAGRVIWFW